MVQQGMGVWGFFQRTSGVVDNQAIPLGPVPVLERLAITTIVKYSMVCDCRETCGTGTNYGVLLRVRDGLFTKVIGCLTKHVLA